MNIKKKNIIELILELLNVKFTKTYADKLYNELPYKHTLFGMTTMLSEYNIKSEIFRMNDRSELKSLEAPFIANIKGDLALAYKLSDKEICYVWREKKFKISIEEFNNSWDGIILLPEVNEDSIEPNYKENKKHQLFNIAQKGMLAIAMIILSFVGFVTNSVYTHWGLMALLAVNSIGVYIGYLLVQKQLYIQNDNADKICSLFKNGGCNDVLDSSAAKFMGLIGWSEVGFSYFISNILIIIFFPQLISYLALINVCALPYSLWSVWYQKFRVKQWCPLCLIVQIVLWVVFIINLGLNYIDIPQFTVTNILLVGCIYSISFLVINMLLPKLIYEKQVPEIINQINQLKLKEGVFGTLLTKQPHYEVDRSTSQIIWGNKDANLLITIVTNPHCNPCATIHNHLDALLKKIGDKICVQYIFTSFNEELESSNKFLIAVYQSDKMTLEEKKVIYKEWFNGGRNNREEFFQKYALNMEDEKVKTEVDNHKIWREQTDISGTPTILINGYELPYEYRIEDLIYFTDLEIRNTKTEK